MSTELEFRDKVVLITGSSGGLGAQIVREFAKRGGQVVVTGRNGANVEEVAKECDVLSPIGLTALQVVGDVTVDEDLKRLVDSTVEKFGKIDILVNNAGAGAISSIADPELISKLENMFRLDVRSVVLLTQLSVPYLEKTKGVIINMSGACSIKTYNHFVAYSMAKSSIDMFTKCLALELGPKGIRVNTVNPTGVRTDFQANAGDCLLDLSQLEASLPLRKLPTPEDVANTVLFLASDKSSCITGIQLLVDCGSVL